MAFPEIRPVVGLTVGVPDTSHPVDLPASGIVAGDLLFSLIDCNGGTIPTFDNTTFGAWRAIDSASNGADHSYRIDAKIADGTENGGTLTHTVSPAGRLTSIIFAISGFSGNILEVEAGTPTINAAGLSHDPPSLTASWGAEDNLWLVTLAMNNGQSVIDVWPTGYTLQQTEGGDGGLQGSAVAMAGRQLAAATDNPDDFVTLAGTGAIANTVVIRPTGASPPVNASVTFAGGSTLSANGIVGTPASVSFAGTSTLTATAVVFNTAVVIPLQDVLTGLPWPDGRTVRVKIWQASDWNAAATGAPLLQVSRVTANGGVLTVDTPETGDDLFMCVYVEEEGTTPGTSEDDYYGCGTFQALSAVLDVNGDAVLVEYTKDSGDFWTIPEYLALIG